MSTLWEKIETWLFVTIITALVWVYAENENVKQHELDVSIRPIAAAGQELQIVAAESVTKVKLSVRCSQSQLGQLKAFARSPFDIPLSADPENTTQVIDIKSRLLNVEPFSDLGVNILDAEPTKVSVSVEAIEAVTAEVRVVVPDDVQLAPGLTIEPARATVRLPHRFVSTLSTQKLEARLDSDSFQGLEDNVPQSLDVPLSVPPSIPALRATITPAAVRVTFTIRKQTDSYMIERVPVALVVSPILMQQWDITVSENQLFVSDVKVSGPSDAIRRIRNGDIKVLAEVRLSADNLDQRIESAVPYIDLPAGVTLDSTIPRINLSIKSRTDGALSPSR